MVYPEEASPSFQERPRICLIDIDSNVTEALTSAGFNCTSSSFGSLVRLPNAQHRDFKICRLNYDIPQNLHEFDILIIDLQTKPQIQYDPSQHEPVVSTETEQLFFKCSFPQRIFDPRALAGFLQHPIIEEIQQKESIIIIFATSKGEVSYHPIVLTARGYEPHEDFTETNYSFLPSLPDLSNKPGRETMIFEKDGELAGFLQKFNEEFQYDIIFRHPMKQEKNQLIKDPLFIPLVINPAGDIVSYLQIDRSSILFMFPQLEDKSLFLLELFQNQLPAFAPSLFPFSTRFAWLTDQAYQLPNEAKLFAEKSTLQQEYDEKIATKEREIEESYWKYRFLHNLLTASGEKLVKTVKQFFQWLEFDEVVNCDEVYSGQNEEDLQVTIEKGLLVVEIKGIGGTSQDSDCSQIGKIKFRRAQERTSFDVFALYIVNHQRYLPPKSRSNPPFTDQQIKDAEYDERGLLTTYDLFKLYFVIESGFITKEDARESLLDFGLVKFKPSNAVPIGKPLELHYKNTVGVFLLQGVTVCVGEELLIYEDGRCRKAKVVSLRDQGRDIAEANEGEIGIKLSEKITKGSELWKPEDANESV